MKIKHNTVQTQKLKLIPSVKQSLQYLQMPIQELSAYIEEMSMRNPLLDVALPLPAHRTTGSISLNDRIDALLAHHERRLNEAVGIIGREPGLNAYEIASRMNWRIKADSWALFPPSQQFFAQSETVAHLDRLFITGRVTRKSDKSGVNRYFLPK